MTERTLLFLHTERPTRRALALERPAGRLVLASDAIEPADAEFYDEVVELPPPEDVAGTLAAIERIPADEAVVQTEYGLLAGSLLARRRGWRAPSPEAAHLTTNKWLCREVLRAAGVPVPRYALVSGASDVRRFAAGRFPIVVKPVASTLGHLVTKVATDADVNAAVARLLSELPRARDVLRCREFARLAGLDMGCDPLRQFLVEDFVDGPPCETDGLVFGDRIDLFGVTGQVVSAGPHFFLEGYLLPIARPAVERASVAAIRALGLTEAGFSIEFRGDVLIEVNGRLGEDDGFPDLFRARLGRFPIHAWLSGEPTAAPATTAGHALAYANWYRDGIVRSTPPAADGVTILVAPGTRLFAPPHPEMAPHLAYAIRTHASGSLAAFEAARDAVGRLAFDIEVVPCAS